MITISTTLTISEAIAFDRLTMRTVTIKITITDRYFLM